MQTIDIREKLHHFIDTIEDNKLEAMYMLFENEIDEDAARKRIIQKERERFLNGEGKSFSPEEVREMAMNKALRNGL